MAALCRIEMLGGLRVVQGERTITRFSTQKTAALLAYLAYYPDRLHPREVLVELFWPESDLRAGRASLSQALASLRRMLEPPGVPAGAIVQATQASVRLNPAAIRTDLTEFEAAVRRAGEASSATERAQHLEEVASLYRGELLPGFYEEWVQAEQRRLGELFFQAIRQLAAHYERVGDLDRALDCGRRAASADPLNEPARADLMRLQAAAGQHTAALREYSELERLLQEELGTRPSPSTRALAQKIELQAAGSLEVRTYGRTDEGPRAEASSTHPHLHTSTRPHVHTSPELPQGTVTFLMTDIEGSTASWSRAGEAFRAALAAHHALLRGHFVRHGGHEAKETGDSFLVAFTRASDALACAVACQGALGEQVWPPEVGPVRVRMALHTGEIRLEQGSYLGLTLHRAARILSAAHGGQILCSQTTAELLRRDVLAGMERGDTSGGPRLKTLGLYRLRDFAQPEPLFQVEHADLPARDFPPPRADAGFPDSLPLHFTRFFGREAEIDRVTELLAPRANGRMDEWTSPQASDQWRPGDPGRVDAGPDAQAGSSSSIRPFVHSSTRLVTLTGMGGTGKTRLALEVARRLAPDFEGAVWFVPLADLRDPQLIGGAIADAMRLPRSPDTDPFDQAVQALARQPSLLVLDNMEQLLATVDWGGLTPGPPQSAVGLVLTLLERVPGLTCLVTSRQRLEPAAEREFVVQPLPVPDAAHIPEQLTLFDSVRLFVDRAQAVRPDFQVTQRNAPAVAELCNRLEGIPLAIELAAARALLLAPAQMLQQLERRFDFLAARRRDTAGRHRTLLACLDWSYELLSPELQRRFARLSVFRGGWTLEAAEAVCGETGVMEYRSSGVMDVPDSPNPSTPPLQHSNTPLVVDPLAALEQLRECSLILAEEAEEGMRYRMLETVREYAAARLTEEEHATEALQGRHLQYYISLAEQAEPEMKGARQVEWLQRLEAEHDNFRAALEWALSPGRGEFSSQSRAPAGCSALRLAGALWRFWEVRGYFTEGRRHLERALAQKSPPEVGAGAAEQRSRAQALMAAGVLADSQGEYDTARSLHDQALAIWRHTNDPEGIATSLRYLGDLSHGQGNYPAARSFYEESLAIWRQVGQPGGLAATLQNLGVITLWQGDYPAARSLLEEGLAIARQLDNQNSVSIVLGNLGVVADRQGDQAAARSFHEEALEMSRQVGNQVQLAVSLNNLASMALNEPDYEAARRLSEESLAIRRRLGDPPGIASSLSNIAMAAYLQGNLLEARNRLSESLTILRGLGSTPRIAPALERFAQFAIAEAQGGRVPAHQRLRFTSAARLYGAAESLRDAVGVPKTLSEEHDCQRDLPAIRTGLGEAAYIAALEAGSALTWEEVVAEALGEREPPGP